MVNRLIRVGTLMLILFSVAGIGITLSHGRDGVMRPIAPASVNLVDHSAGLPPALLLMVCVALAALLGLTTYVWMQRETT